MVSDEDLALLRLLSLLCRLLCLLRHWSNPPLQVGLLRKEETAPRRASAAWHSARVCRPLLASVRGAGAARSRSVGEKVGQFKKENRPFSRRPYFFFAFLAFLAAFFAFFAIVPPEGGRARAIWRPRVSRLVSGVHNPWPEPSTLIPDVDYG